MDVIQTSLLFIVVDDKILLARKKRGFGKGKINGVGGKMQPGETMDQTMLRETMEEIGVVPTKYEKMANVIFDEVVKDARSLVDMSIYIARGYEGEVTESEEMSPMWVDIDKIPYDEMFEDDHYWLPDILAGKKVKAYSVYDDSLKLLSYKKEYVDRL